MKPISHRQVPGAVPAQVADNIAPTHLRYGAASVDRDADPVAQPGEEERFSWCHGDGDGGCAHVNVPSVYAHAAAAAAAATATAGLC